MATILTDPYDFNSLNNGNLDGQDSWVVQDGSSGDWQVQDSVVFEGAKAVSYDSNGADFYKDGTARADGKITVYVRKSSASTWNTFELFNSNQASLF